MVVYKAEDDIAATGKGMRPEVKALLDNILSRPMTAPMIENILSSVGRLSSV